MGEFYMVVIKICRKTLKIALVIFVVCFLGFIVYCYTEKVKIKNSYESEVFFTDQFENTNLISFVDQMNESVQGYGSIEIFDINKGAVIQKVQTNPSVQKEVEGYLKGITGMYIKVKAFPEKGYIIRVPLEPSAEVKNHWLNDYGINSVDEVFILFPENGKPYLMVLDEKKRPLFYNFEDDTDILMENLNFKPETIK